MINFDVLGVTYSISLFQIIFTVIFFIILLIGLIGLSKADKKGFSDANNKIAKQMEEEYKRQMEEAKEYDEIVQDIENEF